MKKLLIVIAVGVALVAGAAVAYSAGAGATAAWEEPADYTYTVQYMAFAPDAGTYEITVRNHKVVAVKPPAELPARPLEPGWLPGDGSWTLADLQAKYVEAKNGRESDATITYDPVTGAPATVTLDWIVNAIDDEQYFEVLEFRPGG